MMFVEPQNHSMGHNAGKGTESSGPGCFQWVTEWMGAAAWTWLVAPGRVGRLGASLKRKSRKGCWFFWC